MLPSSTHPHPSPCTRLSYRILRVYATAKDEDTSPGLTRRQSLLLAALASSSSSLLPLPSRASTTNNNNLEDIIQAAEPIWPLSTLPVNLYRQTGPYQAATLPTLEHICSTCFPLCQSDKCIIRLFVTYPKGFQSVGIKPPFPLVIITPGFLIKAEQYLDYASQLASWGYCCVVYDKREQALDAMTDTLCVKFLEEVIDWCGKDPVLKKLADVESRGVMLVGHSRGGKISTLVAAEDPRINALFLIDPVDITRYAPMGPDFPSAIERLRLSNDNISTLGRRSLLPVGIIGGALGGDCVPKDCNYNEYYNASPGPTWLVELKNAGHLQYLSNREAVPFNNFCAAGGAPDKAVASVTETMMVAFAEAFVRGYGTGNSNGSSSSSSSSSNSSSSSGSRVNKSGKKSRETGGGLRVGKDDEGDLKAGVAGFDVAEALFSSESAALGILMGADEDRGVGGISTRLKNYLASPSK